MKQYSNTFVPMSFILMQNASILVGGICVGSISVVMKRFELKLMTIKLGIPLNLVILA